MELIKNKKLRLLIFIGLGIIVYSSVVFSSKTVNPDAHLIYPLLKNITGPLDYFNKLIHLELYDIQPIRDIFYFIDLYCFNLLNVNFGIFLSVLIWSLICFVVNEIYQIVFPKLNKLHLFLFSLMFLSYPIFCATVSWGIAKKHLLSMLFILLATKYYLKIKHSSKPEEYLWLKLHISFFLSVFSQPISMLWIFWAMLDSYLNDQKLQKVVKNFFPSIVIFAFCGVVNSIYYSNSKVFSVYFESKTSEAFNFEDKILGLGHYIYQSFFPYLPTTIYQLGHWSTLVGLLLIIVFFIVCFFRRISRNELLIWFSFYMFPLVLMLMNPRILSDNYLIISMVGLSILILKLFSHNFFNAAKTKFIFLGVIIFFGSYTFKESRYWLDPLKFSYERGFKRRPSCESAMGHARKSYSLVGKAEQEVVRYLFEHECFNLEGSVAAAAMGIVSLQTYLFFYEEEFEKEIQRTELVRLSKVNFYSKLVLAAWYAKEGKTEFYQETMNELFEVYQQNEEVGRNDYLVRTYLKNYCERSQDRKCLQVISPYLITENTFYL